MFTVTGKVCVLSAIFMVGLVVLWLCHVCCRNIWNFILVRLDSSSRFSRILELSEINRERLRILPTAGGPMTQLAFLTTYVSSPARPANPTGNSLNNRNLNRTRSVRTNGHQNGSATLVGLSNSRYNVIVRPLRPQTSSTTTTTTTPTTVTTSVEQTSTVPPATLSVDSGSEQTLCADPYQSVTLTIASANSPPPSYHSSESILSQATRNVRELPRQTSDSSETSVKSAPHSMCGGHQTTSVTAMCSQNGPVRLQRIIELNVPSPALSSTNVDEESQNVMQDMVSSTTLTAVVCTLPPNGELPPSYEDLFGSSSSASDMSSPDV